MVHPSVYYYIGPSTFRPSACLPVRACFLARLLVVCMCGPVGDFGRLYGHVSEGEVGRGRIDIGCGRTEVSLEMH